METALLIKTVALATEAIEFAKTKGTFHIRIPYTQLDSLSIKLSIISYHDLLEMYQH